MNYAEFIITIFPFYQLYICILYTSSLRFFTMLHNQFKTPFVTLLTKIRHCKAQSYKQLLAILTNISQLKNSSNPTLTKQQIIQLFQQAKIKLRQLQQYIKQQQQTDKQLYSTCKKRIKRERPAHCLNTPYQMPGDLSICEGINNSKFKNQQYNPTLIGGCVPQKWQLKLTRQILHYLLCRYEPEYGEQFLSTVIQSAGSTIDLDDLQPELSTLQKGLQICAQISQNQLTNIKVWADIHNNFLIKIKSPLKFNLIACQFINQINQNAPVATSPDSKGSTQTVQLQKFAESTRKLRKKLKDIQLQPKQQIEVQYLTMLLIKHDTQKIDQVPSKSKRQNGIMQFFQQQLQNHNKSQHKEVSKPDALIINQKRARLHEIACNVINRNKIQEYLIKTQESFKEAFQQIYEIPLNPLLTRTILVGIMVLKGNGCRRQDQVQNHRCPICTKEVKSIDRNIPKLLHEGSTLICRINGSIMTATNYPVVLPNGQIYSISGLESTQNNAKYICMVTNQEFKKQSCKKIFLA